MLSTRNLKTGLSMTGGMTKQKMRRLKARRWKYPLSLERRYTTAISRYLKKQWMDYMVMATQMLVPRMDAVEDLEPAPGTSGPALAAIVSIAKDFEEFNAKELKAFEEIAVGEAFEEEESWVPDALDKWAKEQVSLITKASNDMRDAVARRVRDGVKKGKTGKEIAQNVMSEMPGISFRRARIIARDQASKLNAELSQRRMNEAGLETYVWDTAQDERVRGKPGGKYPFAMPSHWSMQGKICRWDDPTVCLSASGEWEKRPADAPYVHPGVAILCRCVALPNWDELEGIKPVPGLVVGSAAASTKETEEPKLPEVKSEAEEVVKAPEPVIPTEPIEVPEPSVIPVRKKWTKEEITAALASGEKPVEMSSTYWSKLKRKNAATLPEKAAEAIAPQETPITLEKLDKRIKRKIEEDYSTITEQQQKQFAQNLKKLFDNADFGMNVPRLDRNGNDVLSAIFGSYFKSQIETGTGKGMVNVGARRRASKDLFGTDTKKALPREYEKYGFLMDKDVLKQARSGIADQYWSHRDGIQVRFKKDRVTPTFTLQDSLNSGLIPSLVSDPKITSGSKWALGDVLKMTDFDDVVKNTRDIAWSYIELQYHGDLTLDMIESIYVPWRVKEKIPADTIEKMKATGAKLLTTILDPNGKEKLVEF